MSVDLSVPLEGEALLIIDPYPLADSVNYSLSKGAVPIQSAERWLGRTLGADVKLQHHHGDRFTAWVNGAQQRDLVEIKVRVSRKRATGAQESPAILSRAEQDAILDREIASFPATFGLRGYEGVFRISRRSSYFSSMSSTVPTLYTEKRAWNGSWSDFAKGSPSELRGQIVPVAQPRTTQERSMMASRRKQQHLPGIEPGGEPVEIEIPTMGWEQISGDVDPGAHGGTIATADGDHVELIKIQPVREHVGDDEAKDVGFPFWTKTAWFDLGDLDPNDDDVKSAMSSVGLDRDALEDMEPTQRALALADALLDYGRGDEGPAGWSADIGIPEQVKWSNGDVAGSEYLADEDDAYVRDVLLSDFAVDYEKYGPDEENPTSGLKVDGSMSGVEITEWTDIEDANGEEQPEGEKVVKRSATVDLEELIGPGKHVGAYSGFRKAVTLAELAQMDPEDQEETIVAAAISYLAYHGGEEEFVDAIGD